MKTEELVEGECECCGDNELLQEAEGQKMCENCLRAKINKCGSNTDCDWESDADCNWEMGEPLPERELCVYCEYALWKKGNLTFWEKKNEN
jgi:hypothetical protein